MVLLVLLGGTSADEGEGKGQGCSAAKEAAALGSASRSHMIWSAIALFGRRWLTAIGSRVIGLHPCLRSHASMAWRSYVYPSVPITGSCMRDCVIGHTSPGELSRLSMLLGAAWLLPAMSRCCLRSGCLHRVDKEAPTSVLVPRRNEPEISIKSCLSSVRVAHALFRSVHGGSTDK